MNGLLSIPINSRLLVLQACMSLLSHSKYRAYIKQDVESMTERYKLIDLNVNDTDILKNDT